MRRRLACALAFALAGSTWPTTASAQTGSMEVHVQSYRMTSAENVYLQGMSLVAAPWRFDMPLKRWAALSVDGAWAYASASAPSGEGGSMKSFTDTRARVAFAWRRFVATLSASLPTGTSTRTLEEATVLGLWTSDLVPVGVTRWGAGLGVGADLAYRFRLGSTRVGLGGGYSTSGEFTPLDGVEGQYSPGSQVQARAVVDTPVGTATVVSLLVGFQKFADDRVDAIDMVSPGDRLEARISVATPLGARESALLFAGVRHRGAGAVATDTYGQENPLMTLLPGSTAPSSRDLLLAGAELRISRRRWDVMPNTELRILRTTDGVGQGWLTSVGGRADYRVSGGRYGRRLILQPAVAVRFGKVVPEAGAESPVLGWELGLGGRWDLGR